jgi:acetyl esterase/lipase
MSTVRWADSTPHPAAPWTADVANDVREKEHHYPPPHGSRPAHRRFLALAGAPRKPAAVAVSTILLISLYSAFTIGRVLSSNAPLDVVFTLGTADRDVTYCNAQTLDLYLPTEGPPHLLPVAMYVHGGGMTSGDKSDINPVFLNALASAGYAVASINYRLAPMSKFPAQIEDVKCAIRYLRDHAPMYGLNGTEILAFGTSVGGQLVALAALTGPYSVFDVGPFLTKPSSVMAVVDMFGPANLTEGGGYDAAGVQRVFSNQGDIVPASPTHFVVANAPPMLIVQGIDDTKVIESQATELYNALRGVGDHSEIVLVQHMGHMFVQVGSRPIEPSVGQIAQDMVNFFGRYTGGV